MTVRSFVLPVVSDLTAVGVSASQYPMVDMVAQKVICALAVCLDAASAPTTNGGNNGFLSSYGANGVYYRAVAAP